MYFVPFADHQFPVNEKFGHGRPSGPIDTRFYWMVLSAEIELGLATRKLFVFPPNAG